MGIKKNNFRILIAPLDWGLGHTTRCIPIIKYLLLNQYTVFVGANETIKKIIRKEFPDIPVLPLQGYNIRYSKSKRGLPFKILLQLPKILLSIRNEKKWLKKKVEELKIDLVISDNRFGLYTKKVRSIFITHQLQILIPNKLLQSFIQKINYSYINRYTECWIPDFEGKMNLAGALSHPKKYPAVPVKYIGPLSRLKKTDPEEKKVDWLVVLSGPEPQRTILEHKILSVAGLTDEKILIVRGKPIAEDNLTVPANCTVVNHLSGDELEKAYAQSAFVLSRSGYTTVMEVLMLQKKAVLIPTPGQTEQEYLARHLSQQKWCYTFDQNTEDFLGEMNKAKEFPYRLPTFSASSYEEVIEDFLATL